ncbi:hypothetical protein BDA96_01G223300 [Sorghum bicolor]|uniref:Ripening-related protein 4 n=2 Tax=Sorghum bicolor TaxID=4558 RepID=A0A921UYI3_SORBI|nr:putative ripening-related protein 4 [Sorghum bicolor]EER91441.1 hypothetical protein SORBI_3001G209500 [Sorghum bicolor]KAG0549072.1 hypothetical protein BDA96_01G223300 [Sorghum bicolor]|eukprot:XP_002464443.1 putative ripening-related protein 4 [Sorghum bicolor]
MASMKLLVLLALLQVLLLHAHVSEAKKHHKPGTAAAGTCKASGVLHGKAGNCKKFHGSDCCRAGESYPQFRCSPPVSAKTPAILTVNSFEKGKDGGGPSECDNSYHDDSEKVVALSSGWLRLDGTKRCGKKVRVTAGNGRSVVAKVVDECDSVNGCDDEHNFEPPCAPNIVDGSPAVWKALGLNEDIGEVKVTWSDV